MGGSGYGVAIVAALLAGLCLAATGLLQQREASKEPDERQLSVRLVLDLARHRAWLLGMLFGVLSYAFQGVALAFGPLAVVQPVVLSELLFAVPISVRRHNLRLGPREWTGVLSVAAGLAVGIVSAAPQQGSPLPSLLHWGLAMGGIGLLAAAAVGLGQLVGGPVRGSLFALGAAAVLALQSAFLDTTTALMKHGIVEVFTHWQPYALVPSTAIGIVLMQSAYQAAPLAASMPVVDAAEPSVAIVLGLLLFRESVATGLWNLTGTAVGLALFFAGVLLLDTSPLVHRVQRKERQQREAAPAAEAA